MFVVLFCCYFCIAVCLVWLLCFFLMMRRPPRSTLDRSSAASDVYKRQVYPYVPTIGHVVVVFAMDLRHAHPMRRSNGFTLIEILLVIAILGILAVSYTHLRAHETVLDLVCRLLLEKKKKQKKKRKKITTQNKTKTKKTEE